MVAPLISFKKRVYFKPTTLVEWFIMENSWKFGENHRL